MQEIQKTYYTDATMSLRIVVIIGYNADDTGKRLTDANLVSYISYERLNPLRSHWTCSPSVMALWASNGQFITLLPIKNIAISRLN